MKSTGIVRKVDELGRIVLPIELRRVMDIQIKDSLEIMTEDDRIILKNMSHPAYSVPPKKTWKSLKADASAKNAGRNC